MVTDWHVPMCFLWSAFLKYYIGVVITTFKLKWYFEMVTEYPESYIEKSRTIVRFAFIWSVLYILCRTKDVILRQGKYFLIHLFLLLVTSIMPKITKMWTECVDIVTLKGLKKNYFRYNSEEKSAKFLILNMKRHKINTSFPVQVL